MYVRRWRGGRWGEKRSRRRRKKNEEEENRELGEKREKSQVAEQTSLPPSTLLSFFKP